MHHLPDVQAVEHQHQLSIRNLEQQMAAGAAQVKKSEAHGFSEKLKHHDLNYNLNVFHDL